MDEDDVKLLVMEAAAQRIARKVGRLAKEEIPEGAGFAVFVFTLGEGGHLTYASNARRSDMLDTLREFIAHSETGAIAPPGQPDHPANKPGKA